MISIYVITVALAVTAVGQSTHQPFNKLSAYFEVIHKTILLNNGTMEFFVILAYYLICGLVFLGI